MTRDEFIEEVAEKAGLSKADATRAVEAFFEAIDERVKFPRGSRSGRDPVLENFLFTGNDQIFWGEAKKAADQRDTQIHWYEEAAAGLRKEREELERDQEEFRGRLERSRRALREIADSS